MSSRAFIEYVLNHCLFKIIPHDFILINLFCDDQVEKSAWILNARLNGRYVHEANEEQGLTGYIFDRFSIQSLKTEISRQISGHRKITLVNILV